MKTTNKNIDIICCDNAGENNNLEDNCAKHLVEIQFEFTSPGTSHQNYVIEQVFATLYSQMRSMMAHAGLYENLKTGILVKCAATATKLETIKINRH